MTFARSCARETDVLDLVAIEQWPERADAELREHVESCQVCSDLVVAATAIIALRNERHEPAVPDASVVWFRAEARVREEAARQASRPMLAAHGLAAAGVAALSLAWWADVAAWTRSWWQGLVTRVPEMTAPTVSIETAAGALSPMWWLAAGIAAAWLVLLPLALSLARLADADGD